MRGRLADGLYFFQGRAIARGAGAVVFESSDHRVLHSIVALAARP